MGGSRIASVGDEIVVSVKKARPSVLSSDVSKSSSGFLLFLSSF
jgi:ribosomal protein L14